MPITSFVNYFQKNASIKYHSVNAMQWEVNEINISCIYIFIYYDINIIYARFAVERVKSLLHHKHFNFIMQKCAKQNY